MENKEFTKPDVSEIDHASINLDCVDEQLKSMQMGYIAHAFILRDMSNEFDRFYDLNFEGYDLATLTVAEKHAMAQTNDPEYYKSKAMKGAPEKILECFQRLMMIANKRKELEGKEAEVSVAKKNIAWLKELQAKMKVEQAENTSSTVEDSKGSQDI